MGRGTSRDRDRRRSRSHSPRRGIYGDRGRRRDDWVRMEGGRGYDFERLQASTRGNHAQMASSPPVPPHPMPITGGLTILEAAGAQDQYDDFASVQAALKEAGYEADENHKPPSIAWMAEYKSKTEDPANPGAVSTTEGEDSDSDFCRRMRRKRAEYEAK